MVRKLFPWFLMHFEQQFEERFERQPSEFEWVLLKELETFMFSNPHNHPL